MISVNDFKNGISFEFNNNIYLVLDAQHSKSGRGQAHVKTKVKNLRNQAITTITFTGGDKVRSAYLDKKIMQYLYYDNNTNNYIFMDNVTYDQIMIDDKKLKYESNFLIPSLEVQIIDYKGEILGIIMPDKVSLKITEAEIAVKGNSATGATKKAIVETGFEIYVPLFINKGEVILVSTNDGKYSGRS